MGLNAKYEFDFETEIEHIKEAVPSRKHAYIILTPLNPTFIE